MQKGDRKGDERTYTIDTLKGIKVTAKTKREMVGSEKGKLLPTDIGMVVNDFLMNNFPKIMDYHFTANVEEEFDRIADYLNQWGEAARLSAPTPEHFLPLLYVLAQHDDGQAVELFNDEIVGGALSMTSVRVN